VVVVLLVNIIRVFITYNFLYTTQHYLS